MGNAEYMGQSVPIESAKQLEFKMKFMGLVVVALVVLLSILSQRRLHLHLYLLPSRSHQLSRLHLVPRLETWLLPAPPSPPSLSCLLPASFLLEPCPLSRPPASSLPRSSWPRGPLWLGLELLGWRQPEVEKVQRRRQAPEYRDQTLDHMTLVDRIYNVNNAIFALYIHVIICLGQKKLVDFVIDTLYIHVLYTLTSRRLPTTF